MVERSQNEDGSNGLDVEYFLRLTNCIYLISQQSLEAFVVEALKRRRAAYQAADWEVYRSIAEEMGN